MATASPRPRRDVNDSQRRCRHPLQKLRGYIRFYLSAEGIATVVIFLALWFWIGLLLDWGVFKLFTWDWVEKIPWAVRLVGLLVLSAALAGLLVFRVALRLLRDFRDDALALVLERKYPKELGDRLITAVELANTRELERYGYSSAMIEHTIHDAADRVEPLPVQQVFDWKRLIREGLWVVLLTVGLFLLAAAAFSAPRMISTGQANFGGVGQLADVSAIWFERNVLLNDTLWPRRAHLEFVSLPDDGSDLRIPQNTEPPPVVVRAYKWVLADSKSKGGWRPLRWDDLTPKLLGAEVPSNAVPAEWQQGNLTVDDVEVLLDQEETHETIQPEQKKALRDVLEQLQLRAADSSLSRTLRMLKIPESVMAGYRGSDTRGDIKGARQPKNQYTIKFPVLKDSIRFWVRGEDYETPTRNIVTVPPPSLVNPLYRDEYQPAYLYYRLPRGAGPELLRGKKQAFKERTISLFGGDTSRFEVPLGTDVVLTANADKDLKDVKVRPREGSLPFKHELKLLTDDKGQPRRFQVRIDDVRPAANRAPSDRAVIDFELVFTDTDNITGTRSIVIKPLEDLQPDADVSVEVIRKTNAGYLVTPKARIPFSGKVGDDHGLNTVDYVYTLAPLESDADKTARNQVMTQFLGLMLTASPGAAHELLVGALLAKRAAETASGPNDAAKAEVRRVGIGSWEAELSGRRGEYLPLDEIIRRLEEEPAETARRLQAERWKDASTEEILKVLKEEPPLRSLLRTFKLDSDDEKLAPFDLEKLQRTDNRLKVAESQEAQQRYRMQVWVEAMDNDLETGPNRGRSKETFTLLIVPENELLVEVAKEEEALHYKADEMFHRLRGPGSLEDKLVKVTVDLPGVAKTDAFLPLIVRVEELEQSLEKALDTLREIHVDYSRIRRELEVNQVTPIKLNQVRNKIVAPMGEIIDQDFPTARAALQKFRETMSSSQPDFALRLADSRKTGDDARQKIKILNDRLYMLLSEMEQLVNLAKVIGIGVKIQEQVLAQDLAFKKWRKWKEDIIIQGLTEPKKP